MAALDVLKQLIDSINVSHLISLIGVSLFAIWLMRTSLGRTSLIHSRPRRHSMSPIMPFAPFSVWLLGGYLAYSILVAATGPVGEEGKALQLNLAACIVAALTIALILPLARVGFARGLKGFGLDARTVPRDIGAAFVTLLAVWPLVLAVIIVTTKIGHILEGPGFEIPQHRELEVVATFPDIWLRILVVVMAVVMAPLLEEMLFRGLLQSMIRSYVGRPWLAIFATSLLFVVVHEDHEHWPALFVLATGLGYAYERSGSLFQSIFMHAFFNGMVILPTLSG